MEISKPALCFLVLFVHLVSRFSHPFSLPDMLRRVFSPQRDDAVQAKVDELTSHQTTLMQFRERLVGYAQGVMALSAMSSLIGKCLIPGHVSTTVIQYSALHQTLHPTLVATFRNRFSDEILFPLDKYNEKLTDLIRRVGALTNAKKYVKDMDTKLTNLKKNKPAKFKTVLAQANYNKQLANAHGELDKYAGALAGMQGAVVEMEKELMTDDGRMNIVDELIATMMSFEMAWLEQKAILVEKHALANNELDRVTEEAEMAALKLAQLDIRSPTTNVLSHSPEPEGEREGKENTSRTSVGANLEDHIRRELADVYESNPDDSF